MWNDGERGGNGGDCNIIPSKLENVGEGDTTRLTPAEEDRAGEEFLGGGDASRLGFGGGAYI